MKFERNAGILLHPTSLPGKFGIGDLGSDAYKFVDFLVEAGQKLWQVFPLGPTGYGDSPYQCFSAFAGNPLLISPEKLKDDGFLSEEELNNLPKSDSKKIDFGNVIDFKKSLLKKAYQNFKLNSNGIDQNFEKFCKDHNEWLDDFSLFMACKDHHNGDVWSSWDKVLVQREESALKEWKQKLNDEIQYQKFVQFNFFKQWTALKQYANENGIKIIGDMPIFIAYDSSDLWANKELFTVDEEGKLTFVAGVPPDYFSATGQLWGNPLYKWDEMEKDDFHWWRKRFSSLFELVDIVRIDHFRGFEAYWKIPGDAKTAEPGKWVKAPGEKLFNSLKKHIGDLPILAEDLGVITPPVEALRDQFEFPGMKVLQFAFGTDMETKFLPHNFVPNCVVYTGTHDNDTTRAYFEKEKEKDGDIYEHTKMYLNYSGDDILSELIRTAYASVAAIVVLPMQDVLNLGGEARMNFPSTTGGNWTWRFTWDQIDKKLAKHFFGLAQLYERPPKPKKVEEIDVEEN
jgi:4-alpha-glucanotransferase